MRYVAIAIAVCFMLAPLEAATHRSNIVPVKMKKHKGKGHKGTKHSGPKVHRAA